MLYLHCLNIINMVALNSCKSQINSSMYKTSFFTFVLPRNIIKFQCAFRPHAQNTYSTVHQSSKAGMLKTTQFTGSSNND